jgi:hypothetical protein
MELLSRPFIVPLACGVHSTRCSQSHTPNPTDGAFVTSYPWQNGCTLPSWFFGHSEGLTSLSFFAMAVFAMTLSVAAFACLSTSQCRSCLTAVMISVWLLDWGSFQHHAAAESMPPPPPRGDEVSRCCC